MPVTGLSTHSHAAERELVLLFRALTRLRAVDRWQIIERSLQDDELSKEARHLLHQRDLRAARRTH
jgi:hypothetical protein